MMYVNTTTGDYYNSEAPEEPDDELAREWRRAQLIDNFEAAWTTGEITFSFLDLQDAGIRLGPEEERGLRNHLRAQLLSEEEEEL